MTHLPRIHLQVLYPNASKYFFNQVNIYTPTGSLRQWHHVRKPHTSVCCYKKATPRNWWVYGGSFKSLVCHTHMCNQFFPIIIFLKNEKDMSNYEKIINTSVSNTELIAAGNMSFYISRNSLFVNLLKMIQIKSKCLNSHTSCFILDDKLFFWLINYAAHNMRLPLHAEWFYLLLILVNNFFCTLIFPLYLYV